MAKAGGKPFKKGHPGGPGRPKGRLNKATVEIKALAQQLLSDPDYLHALKWRLQDGEAGAIEQVLYFYAYGKPRESVDVTGTIPPLIIRLDD